MTLRAELNMLISRCRSRLTRCEAELVQLARQTDDLDAQKQALALQIKGLQQMAQAQLGQSATLSHGQLFRLLQKQALGWHQLQQIKLQAALLEEKRQQLVTQHHVVQQQRNRWFRQEEKYQRRANLLRRQSALRHLIQDEMEQEESILWKK